VTRGDVYRVRLRSQREQAGARYAVIVQSEALLGLSTAIVALTSRGAAPATFRPRIEVRGETTRLLVEQLRAVDVQKLTDFAGRVSPREQLEIDDALALVLDLR
jgi:mRNA interferase MazF